MKDLKIVEKKVDGDDYSKSFDGRDKTKRILSEARKKITTTKKTKQAQQDNSRVLSSTLHVIKSCTITK